MATELKMQKVYCSSSNPYVYAAGTDTYEDTILGQKGSGFLIDFPFSKQSSVGSKNFGYSFKCGDSPLKLDSGRTDICNSKGLTAYVDDYYSTSGSSYRNHTMAWGYNVTMNSTGHMSSTFSELPIYGLRFRLTNKSQDPTGGGREKYWQVNRMHMYYAQTSGNSALHSIERVEVTPHKLSNGSTHSYEFRQSDSKSNTGKWQINKDKYVDLAVYPTSKNTSDSFYTKSGRVFVGFTIEVWMGQIGPKKNWTLKFNMSRMTPIYTSNNTDRQIVKTNDYLLYPRAQSMNNLGGSVIQYL